MSFVVTTSRRPNWPILTTATTRAGKDSIRIRIAPSGVQVQQGLVGALTEDCPNAEASANPTPPNAGNVTDGSVTNGQISVVVTADSITISQASTGKVLLTGAPPKFTSASCGADFFGINLTLHGAPDRVFGLGQLESQEQDRDCSDPTQPVVSHRAAPEACGTPLDRRQMPGGVTVLQSVKYNIPTSFLYSSAGFGLFFNQPGPGSVVLPNASGMFDVAFSCQKQLDLWVSVGSAQEIYQSFGHATVLPNPLPDYAARYWQSKNAYKTATEVVELAQNFSRLNLSVGVIVIDLGLPSSPPYYRLDPARFPNVEAMSAAVFNLTGSQIMPNLKPTSVASSDCPACGAGYSTDGKADDGKIDPSIPACRDCVWSKRIKPHLFDQGVRTYWLDDDEAAVHFHPIGGQFSCGPTEYCGLWASGTEWPRLFTDGSAAEHFSPMILSRNLWAGATGALWSSDILCTWTELRAQVLAGLSSGLSGWQYWTSDVGGFSGTPSPELAARWHQFGSVCPLYRSHGSRPYNEPWSFGPEAEVSITKSIQLREALHGYIMELSANSSTTGAPMMRPLWWDFPNSPEAWKISDVFMFGPRYLAAPVLQEGARSRTLWLPLVQEGWSSYYTGQHYAGGSEITVDAPLTELPLFVRGRMP